MTNPDKVRVQAQASIADVELEKLEKDFMRFNIAYCACLDDDRLEDWPSFFPEDGRYLIQSRENLDAGFEGAYWVYYISQGMMRDRVTSLRHINTFNHHYYRHQISNLRILSVNDGVYEVRTNYSVVQTTFEGKLQSTNVGEYRDQIYIDNGKALFKEKLVVPDTFHTESAIVYPL
jgi:anthranilate 1,2-dioxygenase small subunit